MRHLSLRISNQTSTLDCASEEGGRVWACEQQEEGKKEKDGSGLDGGTMGKCVPAVKWSKKLQRWAKLFLSMKQFFYQK